MVSCIRVYCALRNVPFEDDAATYLWKYVRTVLGKQVCGGYVVCGFTCVTNIVYILSHCLSMQHGRAPRQAHPATDLNILEINQLPQMWLPLLRYGIDSWEAFMRAINPSVLLLHICIHGIKGSCRRVIHVMGDRGIVLGDLMFTRKPMFEGRGFKLDLRLLQGGSKGVSIASYFLVRPSYCTLGVQVFIIAVFG